MDGGVEIIYQIGLAAVIPSDIIIGYETDRTAAIQIGFNSMPHGTSERFLIGGERKERMEKNSLRNWRMLFDPVMKDRFYRTGHQQLPTPEPSSL